MGQTKQGFIYSKRDNLLSVLGFLKHQIRQKNRSFGSLREDRKRDVREYCKTMQSAVELVEEDQRGQTKLGFN